MLILIYFLIRCVSAITVETYTSNYECPGCKLWTEMIEHIAPEFPSLEFETIEIDFESTTENIKLPYSTALGNVYPFPQDTKYLRRWLIDISHNRSTVLVRNVSLTSPWQNGFDSWVHILSPVFPRVEHQARRLLSTGFAWTFVNQTSFFNTMTYQRVDGTIYMRHNVKDITAVIKDLIPNVVPYAMSEMPSTVSILRYFPMVIYLISPEIPSDLPTDIAWVHLSGTESHVTNHNMSVPSAWHWKRNVEFMLATVERDPLLAWASDIMSGAAEPLNRPSEYKQGELSGDELWPWVRQRKHALVFEYASKKTLDMCRAAVVGIPHDIAQLDVRRNDHESFPVWSKPGMIHYYINGVLHDTLLCQNAPKLFLKEEL